MIQKGKGFLLLVVLALLLGACGTWQNTTRELAGGMFDTVKLAKTVGVTVVHERCKKVAAKCGEESPGVCPALKECQAIRHAIERVIVGINKGVAGVLLAVDIGDKKKAEERLAAVQVALAKLEKLLAAEGAL